MSETKPAGSEAGMENPRTNREIKLTCRTLFNERGELSAIRCAFFSCKVALLNWFIMFLPILAMHVLFKLALRYIYSLWPALPYLPY